MDMLLNLFIVKFNQVFYAVDKIRSVFTCSRSAVKTPEQFVKSVPSLQQKRHWRCSGVFTVSLLLTLKRFYTFFWCFHCELWKSKMPARNVKIGSIQIKVRATSVKKALSKVFFQSIALTLKNSFLLSNGQLHRQSQRLKARWKRLKQLFKIPYCCTERSFYHLLIFVLAFLKMNSKLN